MFVLALVQLGCGGVNRSEAPADVDKPPGPAVFEARLLEVAGSYADNEQHGQQDSHSRGPAHGLTFLTPAPTRANNS